MELLTVRGKPVTIPASTRLPQDAYVALQEQTARAGISMAAFIQQIILKELGFKLPPSGTGNGGGG